MDLPYIKRILKEHLKLVELSVNTRVPLPFETIEFYRLLVSNHGSKYIRDQGIAPKMAKVAKHYYTETVTDDTLSAGVLIELAWFFNLLSTGNEKKSQVKLDNAVLIETLHELLDFEYSCDSVKLHCIWGLRNIAANMAIFGVVGFEMLGYSFATDGTDDKADQALNYLMDFLEGPIASVFEETVMAQDSLANHRTCTCIDDATDASTTFLAMRPGVARNEGVHMVWLATLEQGVACMKNVATWQPMPKEPLLIFIDVVAVLLDQTYKSVSLLSDCCAFLALITERGDTDMRDRLLAAGILSKIKRHFYKGQNLSVVSSILRLIGNLIFAGEKNGKLPSPGTTDCIGVIIDLGYVPLLFSVLDWYPNGQLENLQMRKDALWAISNMCAGTSRHVLSVLAHKGALVTLVTLLKDDPDCHQESAWAIMAACLSDSRFIKFFFNGKPDFLGKNGRTDSKPNV